MQKVLIGVSLCSLLILTGCVSEQSYVGSDKPVSERTFDNIEAARTRISLGLNYLRRGDTSQAKYNLERARSFAPNSAEVYSALAYYYQSVAEDKQAEEYFRLAIQKDNNYADAYNNYGAFLCQLQRYDEAEQLLLKAISRPGYIRVAESYENLALCQLQQNNFSKVKSYLDLSISHNTTRITALTMAAGLAYAMGDNKQAKMQLDRIQRLGRVSARTVLLSYLLAEKSGDREIMRSAEQLLITLYIETPETRMFLQGKLQDSEFEQLRERYKDSLMANIVLPDDNAPKPELPAAPVANPKLKVVKRKNDDSSAVPAVVTSGVAATQNSGTGIANSLVGATTGAVVASLPNNAQLPAETIKADIDYKKQQDAARAKLEAQQQADAQAKAQQVALDAAAAAELAKAQQIALEAERATELAKAELVAVEAEQAAEVEPVISENVVTPAVESESSEQLFHIVQASESLYSISLQHNIRLQRLMDWNQLTPDSVIKTGEKIWLGPVSDAERIQPVETKREQVAATEPFHTVSKGETMFGISYRYNLRLSSFMSWNNFTENSKLTVGQQVYIIDPASATQ
ncbi:type IV pilus biogenesis/stability protein PilW [Rheinheimera metallidurans]|uniref:type IV pilus biogenesis/stability protein PilW n=1 Tax=Rheinheimera metallidurans TaxID=2925781 RepID=UPI0030026D06